MGSLCAFILFQRALFVPRRTNFLRKTREKKCKKVPVRKQWELTSRQQKCVTRHIPSDHHCALVYYCSGTMYRPRDEKFLRPFVGGGDFPI